MLRVVSSFTRVCCLTLHRWQLSGNYMGRQQLPWGQSRPNLPQKGGVLGVLRTPLLGLIVYRLAVQALAHGHLDLCVKSRRVTGVAWVPSPAQPPQNLLHRSSCAAVGQLLAHCLRLGTCSQQASAGARAPSLPGLYARAHCTGHSLCRPDNAPAVEISPESELGLSWGLP